MSFKTVRDRLTEKLTTMTPDERHFMADDALIAAIDEALAELSSPGPLKPKVTVTLGTPIITSAGKVLNDEGE